MTLSHRSHRNNNKKCREEQAKLRRAHRDAGNTDEINFDSFVDSDIEIDNGGIEDNTGSIDSDDGILSERGIVREMSEEGKEVDVLFEADFLENDGSEGSEDGKSMVDSDDDSYSKMIREENMLYDDDDMKDVGVEDDIDRRPLNFRIAEEKADPQHSSYWSNPQSQLVGVRVVKRFGNHGIFGGIIESFKKPYYFVRYHEDDDTEELNLREVLSIIDVAWVRQQEGHRLAGMKEDMDVPVDLQIDRDEYDEVDDNSDADSKSSSIHRGEVSVTVLHRDQCIANDVLSVQEFILSRLWDQRTSPLRFNKVNGGKEVDKVVALHHLHYIETHHLSRVEADDYIKSNHQLIQQVTGKPFNMVKSSKTLRRVFFSGIEKRFPLSKVEIHLPVQFFEHIRTRSNRPLPSLKAYHIPIEVAIGLLLLKASPHDIVHEMKPEYWRGLDNEGEELQERIYTNWCSSKYANDIQRFIRDHIDNPEGNVALLLYVSIFVDGALVSSNNDRSATAVSIAIQNVRNVKLQALVGFVPDDSSVSSEVLDGLLDLEGINKTQRKFILQHTNRQRERDYLHELFTPFMERQVRQDGFDVQVGTGDDKRFYRVFVVFTNFLGDSPQMHSLCGVCNNACHLCMCKNFANFRIDGYDKDGNDVPIHEQERPRDINTQVKAGIAHMNVMAAFINKEDGANTREGQQARKQTVAVLKQVNGYSGNNKVMSIFRLLKENGM